MSTQQDNEKIIWVRGNTQQLLIPLEKEVVSPSGDITTVDFYPDEEAVIKVILYNDYRKYEYTPSLDGNLLTIIDSGTLAVGCYGVAVTVKNPDGTRLHSNWNHQVVVTATNNSVLKEWDEFKEQDVKARAAVFFFAKGDPGTTDYNELINKPFIPTALVDLTDDESHRTVSDTEKTTWNNKANVVDGKVQAINGFEVTGDSASVSGLFLPFVDVSTHTTTMLSVISRHSNNEVVIGNIQVPDLVLAFNNTAVRMTTLAEQGALAATAYQKPQGGIPESDLERDLQLKIDDIDVISSLIPEQASSENPLVDKAYVDNADQGLQTGLTAEQSRAEDAERAIATSIERFIAAINAIIPSTASPQNQLADKAFVNSSVQTNTAVFKGTYNLVADLSLTTSATEQQIATALASVISSADNNDYCFVQIPTSDDTPTQIARVDRYKYNGSTWAFEWSLNNSSFTAAQWAALNSGITSNHVDKLNALPTRAELTQEFGMYLPLAGGSMHGNIVLNIDGNNLNRLKLTGNRDFLQFGVNFNGYVIGDEHVKLALRTGNVDLIHQYVNNNAWSEYIMLDTRNISQHIKTINGESIAGSGNIDTKESFEVTYNVTPYADILAAYNAGKKIYCNRGGFLFFMTIADSSSFYFQSGFHDYNLEISSFYVRSTTGYSAINYQYLSRAISDLDTIRSGAAKGATAYQKPSSGIPESDLTSELQQIIDNVPSILQSIGAILDVVPEQASSSNQLADKNFVNSSVATNTANYISNNGEPFTSLAQLEAYSGTLTNNDYAFVVGTDATGNTTYTRYKYNASQQQWSEEYVLNNSSFTAAQWASINSGIVNSDVTKLNALPTITALDALFAAKQDALVSGTNIKTINNQSVLGSGNLDVKDIFIAEYGVTTAQEIDDAVSAGKEVILFHTYAPNNQHLYILSQYSTSAEAIKFTCIEDTVVYMCLLRRNTGAWSANRIFLENSSSKVTDFTNINNYMYPTTKAVVDYVSGIVGEIGAILDQLNGE